MIVRHHTFRLGDGVAEAAFLDADAQVQTEVAPFVTGFLRRTTARGDDDTWLVETLWWDRDSADAYAESRHEAAMTLRACIDPASEAVADFETLD